METENTRNTRHNGFTCPKCGGHTFGTYTHYTQFMDNKFPDKARVGYCSGNEHNGNGCDYKWNRADAEKEAEAIYHYTLAEHMAVYDSIFSINKPDRNIQM